MPVERSTDESKGPLIAQRKIRAYRLQRRFLVGLALIFLCFCLISAYLIYRHEKNLLVETTYKKSQIIMASVEANRSYVRDVLRPKMYDVLGDRAHLQYFGVTLDEALNRSCVSKNANACQWCSFGHSNLSSVIESKKPLSEEIQSNKGEIFLVHYFPILDDNEAVESIIRYAKYGQGIDGLPQLTRTFRANIKW